MLNPTIEKKTFRLRPWSLDDMTSMVKHANNPKVAGFLRDGFPQPYTPADARRWLDSVREERSAMILAIEVNGEAAGGIGLYPQGDVYRYNGEVGFWLSELHWGKGIMTEALGVVVVIAFTQTELLRLYAGVFEHNLASMRVLEKNGFKRESVHRKAVIKSGRRLDEHLFALLKEDWEAR